MLGILCEQFNCLPSQLMDEDWLTLKRITEYRTMEAAKHQHNIDPTKMTPGMAILWGEVIAEFPDD